MNIGFDKFLLLTLIESIAKMLLYLIQPFNFKKNEEKITLLKYYYPFSSLQFIIESYFYRSGLLGANNYRFFSNAEAQQVLQTLLKKRNVEMTYCCRFFWNGLPVEICFYNIPTLHRTLKVADVGGEKTFRQEFIGRGFKY